jgi:triacylglycerol lipase
MNIVLVHGILGFRKRFGIEYFRGVAEHFRTKGFAVLVPELDPTQGIEFRGDQLCDQINSGFKSGSILSGQKTHIIAHSMGGLDSRYVLSPLSGKQLASPIRSLTTISTPHRGSPIADLVDAPLDLLPFPHLPFGSAGNPLEGALNELGISLNGLRNLTTSFCEAFSARYANNPSVAYFSVAGSGRPGGLPTGSALLLLHHYNFARTGQPNDGLVTVDSATWGTFDRTTWPADHADEVGYNLDNIFMPTSLPYLAKFDQIVSNVAIL